MTKYTAATHCWSNYYADTGRKQQRGDREIRCGLPPHGSGDHTEFDHDGAELVSWPARQPSPPSDLPEPISGNTWLKIAVQVPTPTEPFDLLDAHLRSDLEQLVSEAAVDALRYMYDRLVNT